MVVDRGSQESRKKSLGYLKKILNLGINILIFPEGTQNRTKEIMQPFKEGAFKIAVDTGQAIQPLAVIGAGALMPPGTLRIKPGVIKIVVGDAIPVLDGVDQVQRLKDHTFEVLQQLIKRNS